MLIRRCLFGLGRRQGKFKLAIQAHAVLSDLRRREWYDLGEDEDGASESMRGAASMPPDIANLFAQFGGAGGGARP